MVNVFGGTKRGPEGPPGERGPPGKKGRDALNLIKWFPTLILTELRQHLSTLSLLIEDINTDVTMDEKQVVKSWHSRSKKQPCSFTGYGGMLYEPFLSRIEYGVASRPRWGLLFNNSMYQIKKELLTSMTDVCLTMTFSCKNTKDRQHIINDSPKLSISRGISISISKLCLHGVKENKEIIICDIEKDIFYTIQILWRAAGHEEESWFTLYQDGEIQVPKTIFTANKVDPTPHVPATSLGALINANESSNYFSGIITNVDIIQGYDEVLPQEILNFVIQNQFL